MPLEPVLKRDKVSTINTRNSSNLSKTLMVQGTTSDAGKSTLVAALCRVLARNGVSVAPFKPQNMALNSAVTEDGGEIGRAQALQAQACYLKPHTDMNPVLIKPASDTGAQIIVQGKALGSMQADTYHQFKPTAKNAVFDSFYRLEQNYQAVIVEGAGSPAEINLRNGDIANMGFAEEADCPVIIVADIDKGGVFAHLVGTLELLSASEQARVKGFVINKFRGDIALLNPGLEWLTNRTNIPVLGVLPYLHDLYIDAEDAIETQQQHSKDALNVVVPVLPRISNHTDFDALRLHPQVNLQFVSAQQSPPACDLIILPGSKNVIDDLQLLIDNHWDVAIKKHVRYGGKVIGICGGFQMLGNIISDPLSLESTTQCLHGLGLLPVQTTLAAEKHLTNSQGRLSLNGRTVPVSGYEIHHGETINSKTNSDRYAPIELFKQGTNVADGALSDDNQVFGTYLHGIFDSSEACELILRWAGLETPEAIDVNAIREQQINRLADSVEQHLDIESIYALLSLDSTQLSGSTRESC